MTLSAMEEGHVVILTLWPSPLVIEEGTPDLKSGAHCNTTLRRIRNCVFIVF